jgi:hypothetical protein
MSRGLDRDFITAGDTVSMNVFVAKDGAQRAAAQTFALPTGTAYVSMLPNGNGPPAQQAFPLARRRASGLHRRHDEPHLVAGWPVCLYLVPSQGRTSRGPELLDPAGSRRSSPANPGGRIHFRGSNCEPAGRPQDRRRGNGQRCIWRNRTRSVSRRLRVLSRPHTAESVSHRDSVSRDSSVNAS